MMNQNQNKKIELNDGEKIDFLHIKELCVIQNKKFFCYGIDAVLLADFAFSNIKNFINSLDDKEKTLQIFDFCTGNAIVPILINYELDEFRVKNKLDFDFFITGIEIQKEIFSMAERSVLLNDYKSQIEIKNLDVKKIEQNYEKNSAFFVTANPPYMIVKNGRQSSNLVKMIARQEILCNLRDVLNSAFYLLKENRHFFMVHRFERFDEIVFEAKKCGFGNIKYKFVSSFDLEKPSLVLFDMTKTDESKTEQLSPLVIYEEPGIYTQELNKIYKRG